MARSRILQVGRLAFLAAPLFLGCATMNTYRPDSVVTQSQYTTIENFGTAAIDPGQVDELLRDVAHILGVQLDPKVPKARILVTAPSRIAGMYRTVVTVAAHGADAEGLYFPGASLVMIPYFDRTLLGHELAHYLTDHYLKQAPRGDWEKIAHRVERKLETVKRPPAKPIVVADAAPAPEIVTE